MTIFFLFNFFLITIYLKFEKNWKFFSDLPESSVAKNMEQKSSKELSEFSRKCFGAPVYKSACLSETEAPLRTVRPSRYLIRIKNFFNFHYLNSIKLKIEINGILFPDLSKPNNPIVEKSKDVQELEVEQ